MVASLPRVIGVLVLLAAAPASLTLGGPGSAAGSTAAAADDVPTVLPTPQSMQASGDPVPLTGRVTLVAGPGTDPAAVDLTRDVLRRAGADVVTATRATGSGKEVFVGTTSTTPEIAEVTKALGVGDADGVPAEGYVLASGRAQDRPVVVLDGVDARGTFYAAQTLRQLVQGHHVPGVHVRDWPLMPIRGAIEGFYGIPWSHQARLDQLAFYGRHKMNTYVYTPKDDPLLRARWRDLYTGAALDDMRELVETANANHVDLTFALSPGNDICYSSEADFEATTAKLDQLRELGVTSFYIALDDIPLSFHCDADRAKYPDNGDWHWLADAQADYLDRLEAEYIEPHHLAPLQTVPTNYSGSGEDPYKGEFGDRLDDDVRVQWTGEGVFSDTITESSVTAAAHAYRTDHLYIWDNFPVNDGRRDRLFLNPLTGRAPGLYKHVDGITSNPMIEPYASMPALAGYGDYTWNGPAYDPDVSMAAALHELAGPSPTTREALDTFADLNQSWPYRSAVVHAPRLSADVDAFWKAYAAGDPAGMQPLRDRLAEITRLPDLLADMAQPGFAADARPWTDAAASWAKALQHEIAMLEAIRGSDADGETATRELLAAQDDIDAAKRPSVDDQGSDGVRHGDVITPTVGDGVFDAFAAKAQQAYNDWLGATELTATPYAATGSTTMGTYSTYAIGNMTDGDAGTTYWSDGPPAVGDAVQVDLGAVRPVGSVDVHQADSDTAPGDMLYHAALEYSTDGKTWTRATDVDGQPVAGYDFGAPVQARYVRLRATATNPGGQWVKIREFSVRPPLPGVDTNVETAPGEGAARAFDADVSTAFRAAAGPDQGAYLARTFDAMPVARVSVVGTAAGDLQVRRGDTWTTVAALDPARVFSQVAVGGAPVTGVRILFAPGSAPPQVRELVVR